MDDDVSAVSEGQSSTASVADSSLELHSINGHAPQSRHVYNESMYKLHQYAYEDELKAFTALISSRHKDTDVSLKDMHGNTALHIAVMRGRKECVKLLLLHDAPVDAKNLQGQTPLNEAISYGDRSIITSLLHRLRQQTQESIEAHQPDVERALTQLDDFQLSLKWEFHSWVPLVSRFLPCDTCRIYKKGTFIRMDTTLVDFKDMRWERGNLSFLFDGKKLGSQSLLVMDNEAKVYQWIRDQTEEILEGDVDIMMSTDNETGKMSTKDIKFNRAHTGFIFKEDKSEMVGECMADYYNVQGIKIISVKRREHLSDDDIKTNKSKLDHNNLHKTLTDGPELPKRDSLPPPELSKVTWTEYWTSTPGKAPCIGRQIKCKKYNKSFQAVVAMSQDFPVSVEQLVTVLESIKPLRHFKKLREFLTCRLPQGFPVKLEIPVFPTVTAKVAFEDFQWRTDFDPKFFKVPKEYREDASRSTLGRKSSAMQCHKKDI